MRYIYHIRCDIDLGLGICAMTPITCSFQSFHNSYKISWLPNSPAQYQPRYLTKVIHCVFSSMAQVYNKWNTADLIFTYTTDYHNV